MRQTRFCGNHFHTYCLPHGQSLQKAGVTDGLSDLEFISKKGRRSSPPHLTVTTELITVLSDQHFFKSMP